MGKMQRTKGASAEREVSALIRDLTGWDVRRKVRNHSDDTDLDGAPGWAPEVKRHKGATRATIRGWWDQAVGQAGESLPVLFYRTDRDQWRAVWPVALSLVSQRSEMWRGYGWTVEGTLDAWAAVAREVNAGCPGATAREIA